MKVQNISVHAVRSYDLFSVDIHTDTTLILGKNGTGKTSLLEAIYFLHRGTSFRGRDLDTMRHGASASELKLTHTDGSVRRASLQLADGKIKKQFTVKDKKVGRIAPADRLPVVLFEPDELRLLTSSPARRRDFIDGIIARLSPTYQTVLSRFNRTLLQRNNLLKNITDSGDADNHLFAWNIKFAELSASIIKARTNFLLQSNNRLSELYSLLASEPHSVHASYVSELDGNDAALAQTILHALERSRKKDEALGYTSVGPHRDDIELLLDTHAASGSASRGEMRSIMLAFKLLEVELQEHHSGTKPLILLDDVFSELDSERETKLIEALSGYQTIITATDLRDSLREHASVIRL